MFILYIYIYIYKHTIIYIYIYIYIALSAPENEVSKVWHKAASDDEAPAFEN